MPSFRTHVQAIKPRLPALLLYVGSTASLLGGVAAHTLGFIVLARYLGVEQYGYLATISAVTNLVCPLCGLGAGEAMRRRVSRDPKSYPSMLGHSIILLCVTGMVLAVITSAGLSLFIQIKSERSVNFGIMLLFVSCNVVLYTWIGLAEQILLSHSQFRRANMINAGFGVARAVVVSVACFGFRVDHLAAWAMWNTALYVSMSLICLISIASFGRPKWQIMREELTLGSTMSGAGFLWALRQNIDVLVLSSVEAAAVIGAYGVARRIVGTAGILGSSLDRLIYAKLAVAGKAGPTSTLRLARKYTIYALAITGPVSLGVFTSAPLLPLFFGKEFAEAVPILKILCWTIVLSAAQNIAFDALNAADRHRVRFVAETACGLFGGSLVASLTYAYGIDGAFVATYISEVAITLTLWTTLFQSAQVSPPAKHCDKPL